MENFMSNEKIEDFSKTANAAKLSGAFNQTAGLLKQTIGQVTDDTSLKKAGREQQLLGKVHRLVGKVRGVREAAQEKFTNSRIESVSLCRKHGGRLIDLASDLVDDFKKTIFK
jgi:uncharacterized protein YjbJ (UPF0337 family)